MRCSISASIARCGRRIFRRPFFVLGGPTENFFPRSYAHTLPSQEHLAAEAMDKLFKTA
ncbi:MAG: hypothetical protein WD060_01740 [Pirellulales bacterium]